MRRKTRGLAASILVLGLGCSDQTDDQHETRVAADPTHTVELRDGRVWLDLLEGGQLAALRELAKASDFELALHTFRPRRVALRLEGVTLAEAVSELVGEASFTFEYAFDAEQARHAIAVLHVGASTSPPSTAARHHKDVRAFRATPLAPHTSPNTAPDPAPLLMSDRGTPREATGRARIEHARERATAQRVSPDRTKGEERYALRDEHNQSTDALQEQFREALSDPDPAVREETLEEVEIDSSDARDAVGVLAQSDPNPRVRAAAAETLGDDGTFQAVAELIGMLDDPEPGVLIATLDALDRSGDESIEPHIKPLSDHPNSQVREMASEMLEFWE